MFEKLAQLNITSFFDRDRSHRHDHFLLLMSCWNETEKFCFKCIKANVNSLIFIFWVLEILIVSHKLSIICYDS